mgnify:CR=1 FL=1
MENNYKEYMNYKVYEDGTIISPKGKTIKKNKQFSLTWVTGFSRTVNYLAFIYFVYHQDTFELFSKKVVKSKDGTTNISSLYVIANKQAERKTKVDEELGIRIREEYFSKNRGIAQTNPHKVISIRRLSQKYKLSKPTIQKIINGTYRYCKKES